MVWTKIKSTKGGRQTAQEVAEKKWYETIENLLLLWTRNCEEILEALGLMKKRNYTIPNLFRMEISLFTKMKLISREWYLLSYLSIGMSWNLFGTLQNESQPTAFIISTRTYKL